MYVCRDDAACTCVFHCRMDATGLVKYAHRGGNKKNNRFSVKYMISKGHFNANDIKLQFNTFM